MLLATVAGLCLVMLCVRGHFGADISRRRYRLLLVAGSFYVVLGSFVFLLTFVQSIYDDVKLFLYPANVTVTSNGSDHCGKQKSFCAMISVLIVKNHCDWTRTPYHAHPYNNSATVAGFGDSRRIRRL